MQPSLLIHERPLPSTTNGPQAAASSSVTMHSVQPRWVDANASQADVELFSPRQAFPNSFSSWAEHMPWWASAGDRNIQNHSGDIGRSFGSIPSVQIALRVDATQLSRELPHVLGEGLLQMSMQMSRH